LDDGKLGRSKVLRPYTKKKRRQDAGATTSEKGLGPSRFLVILQKRDVVNTGSLDNDGTRGQIL
jgi:hypothetical protein